MPSAISFSYIREDAPLEGPAMAGGAKPAARGWRRVSRGAMPQTYLGKIIP